jgi:glutathione S-transferase
MLKLYDFQRESDPYGGSRNACKVFIALEEIGEPYAIEWLSRMADCRPANAPYRRLNPNGVTPTIGDDGFILWESGAILRYLVESRPHTGLLPADVKQRAIVQQWLSWEGTTLAPSVVNLFFAMMAPTPDDAAIAAAKAALLGNIAILDARLATHDYVAGDYSIADIALGCLVPICFNLKLDFTSYPHLLAWLKRLRARPAWQKSAPIMGDMAAGAAQLA